MTNIEPCGNCPLDWLCDPGKAQRRALRGACTAPQGEGE